MGNFKKTLRPGTVGVWKPLGKGYEPLFVTVKYQDGRLSLTGVEGPKSNGDAWGACGQCVESLDQIKDLAPGWDRETIKRLHDVWGKWHLNDMRAGCEHQRAAGWEDKASKKVIVKRPSPFDDKTEEKALGWLYEKEHPEGLLCRLCPVCKYAYGSAWLKEEVPEEVLAFLQGLPEADTVPAWA